MSANVPGASAPSEWWWLNSDYAERRAFIDERTGEIAALCLAVPSRWRLPDGDHEVRSICGWYVAGAYKGQQLGQRLVEATRADTPHLNTFSISEAAAKSFARMGWTGPHGSFLRLLALPGWRRRKDGLLQSRVAEVVGGDLPSDLSAAVDAVDARADAVPRRLRPASEWRRRLGIYPDRMVRFHLIERAGEPVAYGISRAADHHAGARYRRARLHFLVDFAPGGLSDDQIGPALRLIAAGTPLSAGLLLFCTSSTKVADAASRTGWMDERSPLIGPSLSAKAPLYMLGGAFTPQDGKDLALTFSDSDIDLNL